jgi:molecular chaperone DnaK
VGAAAVEFGVDVGAVGAGDSSSGDDVIDAEFTESK